MARSFKQSVTLVVGGLAEAFNRSATDATYGAYELGLEGLTAEQVEIAGKAALQRCKFMPSPAELRELAGEVKIDDRAQRAWLAFDEALARFSSYHTLNFDDVIINAVVRSFGGLGVIIEIEPEEYHANFRARWLKAYAALASAPQTLGAEQCGPLLGSHDRTNGKSSQPLLIATGLPPLPNLPRITTGPVIEGKAIAVDLAKRLTDSTRERAQTAREVK